MIDNGNPCSLGFSCLLGIDCGELVHPQNGEIVVTVTREETDLDSTATYSCNTGYRLVGPTVRVCQENEEWTGIQPICECMYVYSF